jgi:hypothetical protein
MTEAGPRRVPASVGQRLLWFLDRHRGGSGALNCPMVCRILGPLDEPALACCLETLTRRHESLRTTFSGRGRQLAQVIHEPRPLVVERRDLSGLPHPAAGLQQALAAELRARVDPEIWPLRCTLWQVGREEHILCLNLHHLVTDTWSCGILLQELARAYAWAVGAGPGLPPAGWHYADFAAWQEGLLGSDRFRRHEEYWRRQLQGAEAPPIPLRSGAVSGRWGSEEGDVAPEVAEKLRGLARGHRTTPFAVMLAVCYTALHRLTGREDLALASQFANRSRPELVGTVGFVANQVVLRTRLPARATFSEVLAATRATVLDGFAHQELPHHLVPRDPPRDAGREALRLDDVVFQMLAEPLEVAIDAGRVRFEGMVPDVVGRFDFELGIMPRGRGFGAKLFYAADRLDPAWAQAFMSAYLSVAAEVAAAPDTPIARSAFLRT